MLEHKNSNSNIYRKENCRKYRIKRKLNERDTLMTLENEDLNIIKINTKFKVDKNKYIENIDYICIRESQTQHLSQENDNNIKLSTLNNITNSDSNINMEMERSLVEKHYSLQNNHLNKLMFS